ncbi:NADP-aldehyde dehydrogenase [Cyathus striatus]|nr:NADP-aldehyde dehydrogenase [Cyathus striatus]
MTDFTKEYIPLNEIPQVVQSLRDTFNSHVTLPVPYRQRQLRQLALLIKNHAEDLADALYLDLGRPKLEAYMVETNSMFERALKCADRLPVWAADRDTNVESEEGDMQRAWQGRVRRMPKGVVLIIVPWNYPIFLSFQPFIGALAAGCCALIKMSEVSPNFSSLFARLIPRYLDSNAYKVALGEVPHITRILEQKFDHIFYTGNGTVARIISAAASKHLTPLTLELGGKSPVIIDPAYPLDLAVKRILWGKISNAGQICVAPDYILLPSHLLDKFTSAVQSTLKSFFPEGALNSTSYSRIISDAHFNRLKNLLSRTRGKIIAGGNLNEEGVGHPLKKKGFEPTVVLVEKYDALMEGEIFGSILPVILVKDVDESIAYINSRDHPLVLYGFTDDKKFQEKIISETNSGGILFNDVFTHVGIRDLPFGGAGESGYGRQGMKATFDIFTYERGICDLPQSIEPMIQGRYPPYTPEALEFWKKSVAGTVVPDAKPLY